MSNANWGRRVHLQPASREENETSGCATEKEDTNNDCHNADKSSSFDEKSDDLKQFRLKTTLDNTTEDNIHF